MKQKQVIRVHGETGPSKYCDSIIGTPKEENIREIWENV